MHKSDTIRAPASKWPQLFPIAAVATLLIAALAMVNVLPSAASCALFSVDDEFRHGWPYTYMTRESSSPNGGFSATPRAWWPFFDDPPLREFRPGWLALDIGVALIIVCLATPPMAACLLKLGAKRRRVAWVTMACLLFSWISIAAFFRPGLYDYFDPLFFPIMNSAIILAIPVPHALGAVAVCWSFWGLARRAFPSSTITSNQLALIAIELTAILFFLAYVVNDAVRFCSPVEGLTIIYSALAIVLGAIAVKRHFGAAHTSRDASGAVSAEPTCRIALLGLNPSTWIATIIVGWTAIYFAFFDQTSTFYSNRDGLSGALPLDAFGWPWMYMADSHKSDEAQAWAIAEGWTIYYFIWQALVANILVCLAMVVGTAFTMQLVIQESASWRRFGLGRLFAFVFVAAVVLWLPTAGDYYVWWPNWFARSVIYFGIACGAYACARLTFEVGKKCFQV